MIIVALSAGLLGLILSLALRRDTGKKRFWQETQGVADQQFVFASLPGVSLLLLGMGALGLIVPGVGAALGDFVGPLLAVLAAAVVLAGLILSFYGMFARQLPGWLIPEWAQRDQRGKKDKKK